MRVNVYGEELTERVEIITKEVDDFKFFGVRLWLKFPNQPWWIHRKVDGVDDDDSSAITLWTDTPARLANILQEAVNQLAEVAGLSNNEN